MARLQLTRAALIYAHYFSNRSSSEYRSGSYSTLHVPSEFEAPARRAGARIDLLSTSRARDVKKSPLTTSHAAYCSSPSGVPALGHSGRVRQECKKDEPIWLDLPVPSAVAPIVHSTRPSAKGTLIRNRAFARSYRSTLMNEWRFVRTVAEIFFSRLGRGPWGPHGPQCGCICRQWRDVGMSGCRERGIGNDVAMRKGASGGIGAEVRPLQISASTLIPCVHELYVISQYPYLV